MAPAAILPLRGKGRELAFNPSKAYDTIEVRDPKDPDKYESVAIKMMAIHCAMAPGNILSTTGQQVKTEHYFLTIWLSRVVLIRKSLITQ